MKRIIYLLTALILGCSEKPELTKKTVKDVYVGEYDVVAKDLTYDHLYKPTWRVSILNDTTLFFDIGAAGVFTNFNAVVADGRLTIPLTSSDGVSLYGTGVINDSGFNLSITKLIPLSSWAVSGVKK